jgi:hypothetical protein
MEQLDRPHRQSGLFSHKKVGLDIWNRQSFALQSMPPAIQSEGFWIEEMSQERRGLVLTSARRLHSLHIYRGRLD